ncbi:unnamed protein product, partial [Amoebophrya sp. A25]
DEDGEGFQRRRSSAKLGQYHDEEYYRERRGREYDHRRKNLRGRRGHERSVA